ncbi:MAG: hypothetical protein JWQ64_2746 [Subtercola sp.]|nr:hypothetical protein [Subtercola sp.]
MTLAAALIVVSIIGSCVLALVIVLLVSKYSSKTAPLKNGVLGTAEVVSVNMPYPTANTDFKSICTMDVVITAPGIQATAASFRGRINIANRPVPGMKLPASIDPAHPQTFVILWDQLFDQQWGQLFDQRVAGEQHAQQIAADLRDHEGKTLSRAFVYEIRPASALVGATSGSAATAPGPDEVNCFLRLQIFTDGQFAVPAAGVRAVPRAALTVVKPGFSFISAWVDTRSPNDFVLDFTQKPPEVKLGRGTDIETRDWLLTNGTDGTVHVDKVAPLDGVRNYRGEGFYVVTMTVTSAKPPYQMVTTQGVPAALVPRVQPGSDLAVKFGSTPAHVTFVGV